MTLMEILIVLAILGTMAAVLGTMVKERLDKSKVSQTKLAMKPIIDGLNLYYQDCGHYPNSMESLIKEDADCSSWGPEPYLKKVPKDGWNREFIYELDGGNFVLQSYGSDGKEGGEKFAKDISSEDL